MENFKENIKLEFIKMFQRTLPNLLSVEMDSLCQKELVPRSDFTWKRHVQLWFSIQQISVLIFNACHCFIANKLEQRTFSITMRFHALDLIISSWEYCKTDYTEFAVAIVHSSTDGTKRIKCSEGKKD